MTATIQKSDIIEGSRARRNREGWQEIDRIVMVKDIAATGQDAFEEVLSASGMPAVASGHPEIAELVMDEHDIQFLSQTVARVTLRYRRAIPMDTPTSDAAAVAAPSIEVGTTTHQTEKDSDYAGVPLEVSYAGAGALGDAEDQVATASVYYPSTTMVIKRRENGSPATKSREYVGTVNSQRWSLDQSAAARTWLCTGIVGTSNHDGSYEVTYTFEYCTGSATGTWDSVVEWRGSNGKIPADLVAGTGRITAQMYAEKDFNQLNL